MQVSFLCEFTIEVVVMVSSYFYFLMLWLFSNQKAELKEHGCELDILVCKSDSMQCRVQNKNNQSTIL